MLIEEKLFQKNKEKIILSLKKANESKFFNKLFFDNGIEIDKINKYQDFKKIPIITKDIYRDNIYDFINSNLANRINIEKTSSLIRAEKKIELKKYDINMISTSGSTGRPLDVFRHKEEENREYFMANMFRNRLSGIRNRRTLLWLWPVPRMQQTQYYETSQGFQEIDNGYKYFLNEYSSENFRKMYDFIIEREVDWITGFPSALYLFSNYVLTNHMEPIHTVGYIECNSEYLHEFQADAIRQVFGVYPTSIYASNETLFIGMTCKNKNMHILDNSNFVELIPNKDGINEVIVTKLNNKIIPLIRYNLGDYAEWDEHTCNCEVFSSPIIKLKSFRKNDYILKENGEKIEPLNIIEVMLNIKYQYSVNILQYQYVQLDYYDFDISLFIVGIISEEMKDIIYKRIKEFISMLVMHEVEINIRYLDSNIPPDTINGKFKYFISKVKV